MSGADLGIAALRVLAPVLAILIVLPMLQWVERRGAGLIQDRPGPNRVGPAGLFQPIADTLKLLLKEDFSPRPVNTFYYWLAPALAMMPAIITTFILVFSAVLIAAPIGVFTAFSMAGFGMARYQSRQRTPGWRRRQVINFSAGVTTAIVVAVFAVVKFTEGAWVVLVLFAILVPALIRMNQEYSAEGEVLETISENQPPPPPPADPPPLRPRARRALPQSVSPD